MTTDAKHLPLTIRQFRLAAHPVEMPRESDFTLTQTTVPVLGEGQVLARTIFLSVDPYVRRVISGDGWLAAPIAVGSLVPGLGIGRVVQSPNPSLAAGDYVLVPLHWKQHVSWQEIFGDAHEKQYPQAFGRTLAEAPTFQKRDLFGSGYAGLGEWGWQDHLVSDGKAWLKLEANTGALSAKLGILGLPGLTAYFGLIDVCQPRVGETVLVSGAAGAVGSIVGQIARKAVG